MTNAIGRIAARSTYAQYHQVLDVRNREKSVKDDATHRVKLKYFLLIKIVGGQMDKDLLPN